ncbi:NADH-quinone oxidoreductase subunit C [Paenibacillus sp. sptzw28]|uniref:NADH-quinone oxidoreductase subunit C n=1 Tax=Paenibacillus sp. sptzw28 TaxID=715179 RepID=UPI00216376A8|nr:NADH-quinone oxidoreductase subunit C [Paenibacillus sp. sptzw28]
MSDDNKKEPEQEERTPKADERPKDDVGQAGNNDNEPSDTAAAQAQADQVVPEKAAAPEAKPPAAAAESESEPVKPEASAAEASAAPKADPEREAKLKAAADARAARAAAKISAVAGEAAPEAAPSEDAQSVKTSAVDPEREAKLKAAEEARAARAAAKAESEEAAAEPKAPSPKQPQLDEAVGLIQTLVAGDAIEEAYINELNDHMPTIIVKGDRFMDVARLFKSHNSLDCGYLRNVSGVDYETHLEVVYHLVSLSTKREYALKVKTDREKPQVASAAPIWATANWNEREIFDLLGIDFTGHPDLRRIMMPDDWVGHPLRKDYEPLDPEV